ncbi:MAG: hypothetical protein H0W97_08865, partial [Actinobacteria bacterium]|nr:hypothetical protein [Actinomycetota bacterium]
MARRIRVVVGEGRTAQRGLLRFVLEGEGFDVVGEAEGSADLSGVIEQQRPDVVVLDDGIGVMAVSMVHEAAPDTKVVLVWPAAVIPIGGDARVEPAKILKDLGPAVQHVAAAAVGLTAGFQQPEWIEKVRKDPATLREKLGGKETATRPSVTRLQRGTRRLRPIPRRSKTTGLERREEVIPVPLIVLPGGDGGTELEPVLDIGGAGAIGTGAVAEPVEERSEWNRRLGTLALSGAAAVSALVLALALGGGRIPVNVVRGGGTLPAGATAFDRPGSSFDGPFGAGSPGGSGFDPIPVVEEPAGGPDQGGGGPVIGGTGGGGFLGGGIGGDLARPGTSGGSDTPTTGGGPGDGDGGGGD